MDRKKAIDKVEKEQPLDKLALKDKMDTKEPLARNRGNASILLKIAIG